MASTLTYVVVAVGVLFYVATQRSRFAYQLKQEIQAPPEVCVEYMRTHSEQFVMRTHPYMTRVETLDKKEASGHVFIEENLYEAVPLLPFYKRDVIFHTFSDLDTNRNIMYFRIANEKGPNDFMGSRTNLTFDFAGHPEREGWTLITDTISNDFSYGISLVSSGIQRSVHEKMLRDLKDLVEEFNKNS